jgi:hypothetical protein
VPEHWVSFDSSTQDVTLDLAARAPARASASAEAHCRPQQEVRVSSGGGILAEVHACQLQAAPSDAGKPHVCVAGDAEVFTHTHTHTQSELFLSPALLPFSLPPFLSD